MEEEKAARHARMYRVLFFFFFFFFFFLFVVLVVIILSFGYLVSLLFCVCALGLGGKRVLRISASHTHRLRRIPSSSPSLSPSSPFSSLSSFPFPVSWCVVVLYYFLCCSLLALLFVLLVHPFSLSALAAAAAAAAHSLKLLLFSLFVWW